MSGAPLPDGWLGKPWACQQLAQAASGELLLFVDADTRLEADAIQHAVCALAVEHADLLTALPRQVVGSFLERLLVPIFGWGFFAFLPLALAYRSSSARLAAAVGQFMLFRQVAYQAIGGHSAVRDCVIDDMSLARHVKACGFRWRLMDGTDQVRCRMYHGAAETLAGFSKNLFAVFEYRLVPYILIWAWTWAVFCLPPIRLVAALLGYPVAAPHLELAGATTGASLLLWTLFYWRFRYPLYLPLFYPGVVSTFVWTALRALLLSLRGQVEWKGRALGRQRVRWF
jgi:chlorobactene glucosyltransferase